MAEKRPSLQAEAIKSSLSGGRLLEQVKELRERKDQPPASNTSPNPVDTSARRELVHPGMGEAVQGILKGGLSQGEIVSEDDILNKSSELTALSSETRRIVPLLEGEMVGEPREFPTPVTEGADDDSRNKAEDKGPKIVESDLQGMLADDIMKNKDNHFNAERGRQVALVRNGLQEYAVFTGVAGQDEVQAILMGLEDLGGMVKKAELVGYENGRAVYKIEFQEERPRSRGNDETEGNVPIFQAPSNQDGSEANEAIEDAGEGERTKREITLRVDKSEDPDAKAERNKRINEAVEAALKEENNDDKVIIISGNEDIGVIQRRIRGLPGAEGSKIINEESDAEGNKVYKLKIEGSPQPEFGHGEHGEGEHEPSSVHQAEEEPSQQAQGSELGTQANQPATEGDQAGAQGENETLNKPGTEQVGDEENNQAQQDQQPQAQPQTQPLPNQPPPSPQSEQVSAATDDEVRRIGKKGVEAKETLKKIEDKFVELYGDSEIADDEVSLMQAFGENEEPKTREEQDKYYERREELVNKTGEALFRMRVDEKGMRETTELLNTDDNNDVIENFYYRIRTSRGDDKWTRSWKENKGYREWENDQRRFAEKLGRAALGILKSPILAARLVGKVWGAGVRAKSRMSRNPNNQPAIPAAANPDQAQNRARSLEPTRRNSPSPDTLEELIRQRYREEFNTLIEKINERPVPDEEVDAVKADLIEAAYKVTSIEKTVKTDPNAAEALRNSPGLGAEVATALDEVLGYGHRVQSPEEIRSTYKIAKFLGLLNTPELRESFESVIKNYPELENLLEE